MKKISVISLVSYDAEYLPESIRSYYDYVDEIVLGLDKNRITWNGNSFIFDESSLWQELKAIDTEGKISVIQESFYNPNNSAQENDNMERNILKGYCVNPHILSIDADEVLLNAKEFFYKYLPIAEKYIEYRDICMLWATPFKQIDDVTLVITNEDGTPFLSENQGVLTKASSVYTYSRWTNLSAAGHNRLISPLIALHWSLARAPDKLFQKINNTGHADIVSRDPFYNIWISVTLDNYKSFKNFRTSGIGPAQWPSLGAVPTDKLSDFYLNNRIAV